LIFASGLGEAVEGSFGTKMETTLSEDDCNFAMHYISGWCEEQAARGSNTPAICDAILSNYLKAQDLFTKDLPTDTEKFNGILDQYNEKRSSQDQERAQEEENKPS